MRDLLIKVIKERYNRPHNKLDEVYHYAVLNPGQSLGMEEDAKERERYSLLKQGKISIDEWLAPLTDYQLIHVFESQCCQSFR